MCATHPATGQCAAPGPTAAATPATTGVCATTGAGIVAETAVTTAPHARPGTTTLPAAITATGAATLVAKPSGNITATRINPDPARKDEWLISEAMFTEVLSPCDSN